MSAYEEVRAELLSPAELDARVAQSPIAYLPLGTLEFHGPHLPIGLDAFTGHGVCVEVARHSGGIVLPAVYQGFGGGHGHYPWTMMMADGEGISAHLRATLARLEDFGVRTAAVFSGHFAPEQLDMLDELAATWGTAASIGSRSSQQRSTGADPHHWRPTTRVGSRRQCSLASLQNSSILTGCPILNIHRRWIPVAMPMGSTATERIIRCMAYSVPIRANPQCTKVPSFCSTSERGSLARRRRTPER